MATKDLNDLHNLNGFAEMAHVVRNGIVDLYGIKKEFENRLELMEVELNKAIENHRKPRLYLSPTGKGIRSDAMGSGLFGAKRGDKIHRGVDFLGEPGQSVKTLFKCIVKRQGQVYVKDDRFKLIVMENDIYEVKYMYAEVDAFQLHQEVPAGHRVGILQDVTIQKDYKQGGMNPHLHVEIRDKATGKLINPLDLI